MWAVRMVANVGLEFTAPIGDSTRKGKFSVYASMGDVIVVDCSLKKAKTI
jgi:hypothetical protein